MSDQDMADLLLGLGAVVVGWHLYKMYQAKKARPENAPITGIPAAPLVQQNADGTYFFDMNTLFEGAI